MNGRKVRIIVLSKILKVIESIILTSLPSFTVNFFERSKIQIRSLGQK
ncbi:unnamed protein product [Haemonchus placei]|uniref:Uncharacterized protein n=1 Tax=Haemonchus placei TaxID=6290 RepID=A0A0N4XAX3_HAEPC|nr:unnamed protein product [Haemonchus placei]